MKKLNPSHRLLYFLPLMLFLTNCNWKTQSLEQQLNEQQEHESEIAMMDDSELQEYCQQKLNPIQSEAKKILSKINYNHPSTKEYEKDKLRIENAFKNLFKCQDSSCNSNLINILQYDDDQNLNRDSLIKNFKLRYLIYSPKRNFIFMHATSLNNNLTFIINKDSKSNIWKAYQSNLYYQGICEQGFKKNDDFVFYKSITGKVIGENSDLFYPYEKKFWGSSYFKIHNIDNEPSFNFMLNINYYDHTKTKIYSTEKKPFLVI